MGNAMKSLFFVTILSVSCSAWAMNEKCAFAMDTWLVTFYSLGKEDLFSCSLVCKKFNSLFHDSKLWESLVYRLYGRGVNEIKKNDESWEEFARGHYSLKSHIFDMPNWEEQQDIETAIGKEVFSRLEHQLLKHLEINYICEIKVKNNKDLLAFIYAYYVINFDSWLATANNVVYSVEKSEANVANYNFGLLTRNACFASDWFLAREAGADARNKIARYFVSTNIDSGNIPACILPLLNKIEKKNYYGQTAWRLGNLLVLAYLSQSNHITGGFDDFFKNARAKLDATNELKMSKDEIINIWAQDTWEKESMASNPYIVTFRKVIEAAAFMIEEEIGGDQL